MALTVRIAQTREEILAVQRFRHRVFVEQDGSRPPRASGRIVDDWDDLPPEVSRILVAYDDDDEIVGTLRFTLPTDTYGTPADEVFPFARYLEPGVRRVAGSSMCVDATARGRHVAYSLIFMFHHHAAAEGCDEIYAAVNPDTWTLFAPMGVQRVSESEEPLRTDEDLPIVPFVFRMRDMTPPFQDFVDRHGLRGFLDVWVRRFFRPKELVARRGELATHAFVIVGGTATVRLPDGRAVELDRPYLVGDELMATGGAWPYDVIAGKGLEVIVIDRDTYFERVLQDPHAAVRLGSALLAEELEVLPAGAGHAPLVGQDAGVAVAQAPRAQLGGQRR